MGKRRMDVGFAWGRECRLRQPAAVDLTQLRLEKLDRRELEHGVCRRSASAGRRMAFAALHKSSADAYSAREAVPAGECCGRVQRTGSGGVQRQRRHYVARWRNAGTNDSN